MLTVKHISEFGFETIVQAATVATRGREYPALKDAGLAVAAMQHVQERSNFLVECSGPSVPTTFGDGQVFVMNDAGKTVASYDMRAGTRANKQAANAINTFASASLGSDSVYAGT